MRERERESHFGSSHFGSSQPAAPFGGAQGRPSAIAGCSQRLHWVDVPLSGGGGGLGSHVRCRVAAVAPRQVCSTEPFTCRASSKLQPCRGPGRCKISFQFPFTGETTLHHIKNSLDCDIKPIRKSLHIGRGTRTLQSP